jgi:hypothetical protein
MPKNSDVDFTFDTSAFDKAMKNISNKLLSLPSMAGKAVKKTGSFFVSGGKKMAKGIKNGIKKIPGFIKGVFSKVRERFKKARSAASDMSKGIVKGLQNVALKAGLVALAMKGIQGILSNMPEIGQAFGIAKDVFLRNLLFPLRKAVFPLLQKLVDWVRNNRLMFIRWGQTLANIFLTIVDKVKMIIAAGKELTSFFLGFINDIFGTSVNDLTELFNLLTFKFALMIEFLRSQSGTILEFLSPIIDIIKIGLSGAFESLGAFFAAFLDSVQGIEKPLLNILKTIRDFTSVLFDAENSGANLQTTFKEIGRFLGNIFSVLADVTDSLLKGFLPAITKAVKPINDILKIFNDVIEVLFKGEKSLAFWKKTAEIIGKVLASSIVTPLKIAAFMLKVLMKGFSLLGELAAKLFENEKFKSLFEKGAGFGADLKKGFGDFFESKIDPLTQKAGSFFDDPFPVNDAIITKTGKVIKTSPDDNIIATKNNISLPINRSAEKNNQNNSTTINIDMSGLQMLFNDSTRETAEEAGLTIVDVLRRELNKELTFQGS